MQVRWRTWKTDRHTTSGSQDADISTADRAPRPVGRLRRPRRRGRCCASSAGTASRASGTRNGSCPSWRRARFPGPALIVAGAVLLTHGRSALAAARVEELYGLLVAAEPTDAERSEQAAVVLLLAVSGEPPTVPGARCGTARTARWSRGSPPWCRWTRGCWRAGSWARARSVSRPRPSGRPRWSGDERFPDVRPHAGRASSAARRRSPGSGWSSPTGRPGC